MTSCNTATASPLAREGTEWIVNAGSQAVKKGKLSEGAYLELCKLSKDWHTGQTAYAALQVEHAALKALYEAFKVKYDELREKTMRMIEYMYRDDSRLRDDDEGDDDDDDTDDDDEVRD